MTLPTSYFEAVKYACCREAMKSEVDALEANNTWEIMDLLKGKVPIDSKIVYKIKFKANGEIKGCKIRIVAKGLTQQEGIDYMDTFSLVAKMSSVHALLALVATNGWFLHQMDINNAFLHGDLVEEIYMKALEGYAIPPGKVLKLNRSLYGIKQTSRQWYRKLLDALLAWGFTLAPSDYSMFVKREND